MLSINMRIFKTVLLLVGFGAHVQCLPVDSETASPSKGSSGPFAGTSINEALSKVDQYDQRQNGTDNYRVDVDGLVVVFAPLEALLLAGTAPNASDMSMFDPKPTTSKPSPAIPEAVPPSPAPKSTHSSGVHLADFIIPLLRRLRHK